MTIDNSGIICKQFNRLVEIMEILRSPNGCSWDKKQSHATLCKYIKEEADEVVEAIESGDLLNLREELGDLLMLIVFNAQIAKEIGTFTISEVCEDICKKLIHRHPHVFSSKTENIAPDQVIKQWGEIKKDEKIENKKIATRMRETLRFRSSIKATSQIQKEAANVGFDFPNSNEALKKVYEEADEVKEIILGNNGIETERLNEEIGDLLFATINVARLSNVDASAALRQASEKFMKRFSKVEDQANKNGGFEGKSIDELDKYWDKAKAQE